MDYKETIKKRLDVLSPGLQTFILDENWRRDAEKIGKQFSFDEEKYASFENEVFLALLCFEPKEDFVDNIKNELKIDKNMADWISEDVKKNIFSRVANELNAMWQSGAIEIKEEPAQKTQNNTEPATQNEGGVGESFEQIILNQARAMQPAVAQELSSDVAKPAVPPENLPISEGQKEEKPGVIHNYMKEDDPYREPAE